MYHIYLIDYATETEIFSYDAYCPPYVTYKDTIRISEMKEPDFPDNEYIVNKVSYSFERNGIGEVGVFVVIHITKII